MCDSNHAIALCAAAGIVAPPVLLVVALIGLRTDDARRVLLRETSSATVARMRVRAGPWPARLDLLIDDLLAHELDVDL